MRNKIWSAGLLETHYFLTGPSLSDIRPVTAQLIHTDWKHTTLQDLKCLESQPLTRLVT